MSVSCVLLLLGKLQLEGKSLSFSDNLSTVFVFFLLEDKRIFLFFLIFKLYDTVFGTDMT